MSISLARARDIRKVCLAWQNGRLDDEQARDRIEELASGVSDYSTMPPHHWGASTWESVLWCFGQHERLTSQEVRDVTGLAKRDIHFAFSRLAKMGRIRRVSYGVYALPKTKPVGA